jgi:hypothetical protein
MYQDVYNIFKSPIFVSVIKERRLEWIKVVAKISDGRRVKELLEGKTGGRSKQGRPRLRWMNDVKSDLMIMGVGIWENRNCGRNRMGVFRDGRQG